jgi:UPF0271 protein
VTLDLNADVGESFGAYTIGDDVGLMRSVTSVNVAAGFHGGDPSVLRSTIRLARDAGAAVGAHPGFPDMAGFGRRAIDMGLDQAEDLVLYQIAAVAGVARAEGVALQHVKPHGALYNMAAVDAALAGAIARAVATFDRSLMLVGPCGSQLLAAGRNAGLRVAAEAFADRAYLSDGTLAPRSRPGAVLQDPDAVAARAGAMIAERRVSTLDGGILAIDADTLCVHSDTPGASVIAALVRRRLEDQGVDIRALGKGSAR